MVNLPCVLTKNVESILKHLALGIAFDDVGRRCEASREKICQGENVAVVVRSRRVSRSRGAKVLRRQRIACRSSRSRAACGLKTIRPRALGAVKGERAALTALIEVINLCLAEFTSKAKLMRALSPGERIVDVAGNIVAAGVDGNPDRIETIVGCDQTRTGAGSGDVCAGGTRQTGRGDSRIEAERDRIKTVIRV